MTAVVGPDVDRASASPPTELTVLERIGQPFGLVALILVFLALQALYGAHLPLFGDEAYYWAWSRQPALSYFDHPPMVAWLLRLATMMATSEAAVRLVPLLCTGLSAWLVQALARDVYGKRAAVIALLCFLVMPATQFNVLVATPDAPLMLFWTLALYAGQRAVFSGGRGWHLLTGAAVGCALLSKYTAILFPGALLAFLLLRRRDVLARGDSWLAMLVAVLVFSPVLLWNSEHHWISFAFQYGHGTSPDAVLRWGPWIGFLAGTAMIVSPVLFVVAVTAVLADKTRRDGPTAYLSAFFLLPLAFFVWKGLFHKIELNWAAVAFPAATVLAAGFIARRGLGKTLAAALACALLLSLAIRFPVEMGLPAKWNPLNRLYANRAAVQALLALRRPAEPLLADHYTTASLLRFYAPDHPVVRIPTPSRYSQYDLWATNQPPSTPKGLYLAGSERGRELALACGRVALLRVFAFGAPGFVPQTFYFYRCGA